MAAAIVPNLKDERFVCQKPCGHRDCVRTRTEWTDATCAICHQPLSAGQLFYYVDQAKNLDKMHAVCYQEQIEKERKETTGR